MWESEKETVGKMTEIYTIFDQSYDNDNYTTNDNYTSFELFQQYQYKSECTISILFIRLFYFAPVNNAFESNKSNDGFYSIYVFQMIRNSMSWCARPKWPSSMASIRNASIKVAADRISWKTQPG